MLVFRIQKDRRDGKHYINSTYSRMKKARNVENADTLDVHKNTSDTESETLSVTRLKSEDIEVK